MVQPASIDVRLDRYFRLFNNHAYTCLLYTSPVFYTYGKNDGVIPKYELFATAAWLEEHTWLKTKSYHGLDHNVSLEEFADLRQWLLDNDITSGVL